MNHLKSYNNFEPVNEELGRTPRIILNLPTILISRLIQSLTDSYPLLNLRWRELKAGTKDSKYDPIIGSGGRETFKNNLTEITKKDLPSTNLGLGMFLRNWKLYSSDRMSTGGRYGENVVKRPVVYISKDELKNGDVYSGYRLRDEDIYSDFKKNDANFPIMVMAAKYDKAEENKEIQQYVDDICLYMEDDFPLEAKPNFNATGDYLSITCKVTNNRKELICSEGLLSTLEDVAERTKDYLNSATDYEFESKIVFSICGPLYYSGNDGRFSEIRDKAIEYTEKWHYDTDFPLIVKRKASQSELFNISRMWATHDNDLVITPDDIRTLKSDINKCHSHDKLTRDNYSIDEDYIKTNSISIRFAKVRS